jgi:hypothetical protein
MDDTVKLTLAVGSYFYFGTLGQWKEYARVLTSGRIGAYRKSALYGCQSLSSFFKLFRGLWNTEKASLPTPEEFGLISLRPENLTQTEIIDELINA